MPKPRVITEQEDFPIKPSDINAAKYMCDAFGNMETDMSAGYIVRLMQKKGDWGPFTYGELNAFYKATCKAAGHISNYSFNHLIGGFRVAEGLYSSHPGRLDVIVREGNEKNEGYRIQDNDIFHITDEFVFRCYRSAGIPRMKPAPQPVG